VLVVQARHDHTLTAFTANPPQAHAQLPWWEAK
jgi:hypothetical protein